MVHSTLLKTLLLWNIKSVQEVSKQICPIGTDNGLPVVPKFEYAKVLPKYFRGTIEKVEFDLGPAKLSAEDLQRIYVQRFAGAVRN